VAEADEAKRSSTSADERAKAANPRQRRQCEPPSSLLMNT